MIRSVLLAMTAALALLSGAAQAGTLEDVKARGELWCGSNVGLAGFGMPDANGTYQGFDVALCKAVAAAVLGDATKVKYVPLGTEARFTALAAGDVDLLVRNTTLTFSGDTDLNFDVPIVNYYDGQGFMVKKDLGVSSAKELDGDSICVQAATTTDQNLAEFFKANNMSYTPVSIADDADGQRQYMAGACDVYTNNISILAATRATMVDPENQIILPEVISKEPLGPFVRHGDNNWGDIVRWTFYALVTAEELGITQANIEEVASTTQNAEARRLLGLEGNMGAMLGLDKDWARRAIAATGNYGEVFEANIGQTTPIGLARGLNALWSQGGLMYAPPFR